MDEGRRTARAIEQFLIGAGTLPAQIRVDRRASRSEPAAVDKDIRTKDFRTRFSLSVSPSKP